MRRPLASFLCVTLIAAACSRGQAGDDRCVPEGEPRLLGDDALVLGSDLANPPFAASDDDGPTGLDIDLLREAAKRIGRDLRVVRQTYAGLIVGLRAQRFDLVASGIELDDDVGAQACATAPYLEAPLGVVARGDVEGIDGVRVAVHEGTAAAAWAAAAPGPSAVRAYATADDPFVALRTGAADAVVAALPVALHHVRTAEGLRLIQEAGPISSYVFLADEGNGALAAAIDEVLSIMREDGTYARIHERWLGRPPA